jgi:hypothetical protein
VYARSGKVMVRIPERAVTVQQRGCAYLVAGPNDDATAAVARVILERKLLGDFWRFAADGHDGSVSELAEAMNALARSGNLARLRQGQDKATGVSAFLARMEKEGYGYCLLFVPPGDHAWLDTVVQGAAATAMRLYVIMGVDGIGPEAKPLSGWRRVLFRPPDEPKIRLSELRRSAGRWQARAERVAVVDRRTGQMFTDLRDAAPKGPGGSRNSRKGMPAAAPAGTR